MYLHKSDRDDVIWYLAEKYPQCFFENPGLRRPLKHNILDDLEKERVLDRNKLAQALDGTQIISSTATQPSPAPSVSTYAVGEPRL